jgi:hypothetical protein
MGILFSAYLLDPAGERRDIVNSVITADYETDTIAWITGVPDSLTTFTLYWPDAAPVEIQISANTG